MIKSGMTEEEYLSLSAHERIVQGMGRVSSLSEEELADIAKRLRDGEQRKDIAASYGMTPQRMSQIAKSIGADMREQSGGCELTPVHRTYISFSQEGWEWLSKQNNISDAIDKVIKFYVKNHQKK